jgi:uncharacterized protein (DUF362 family)
VLSHIRDYRSLPIRRPFMKSNIDRRAFVKRCAAAGAAIIAGAPISRALGNNNPPVQHDLCAVVGDRYFDNTMKALDGLGGIQKFVRRGNTVGILVNSPLHNAGAYAKPDIPLAVVKMCLDAGAKQIYALNDITRDYWRRSTLSEKMQSEIGGIAYVGERTEVTIDRGKALKTAEISKALLACDVYINIPIIKDHEGTRFTCSLKNTMGACSDSTCRQFHFGKNSTILSWLTGGYDNIELLSQSIADVNLIRQPDLCIVDATEFLVTNGPSGPGEVRKAREVIATTNCLAADMYSVRHLGLDWEELPVLRNARDHGYGPKNLKEIRVQNL